LKSIPGYVTAFQNAFPADKDALTYDNLGRAIGAFERGLTTPARWDKYLTGDKTALTAGEIEGLKIFTNVGCMVCHTVSCWAATPTSERAPSRPGLLRMMSGARTSPRHQRQDDVQVPTLRNIEKTAPYFHDGSAKTLEDAVHVMGEHQLGLDLSYEEVSRDCHLAALRDRRVATAYIAEPQLPPGLEKTADNK